jgi:hypothetical protein
LQQLLELSIWADLRDGGHRARLLITAASRLGFGRVLLPTAGPLGGPPELLGRLLEGAPEGSRVVTADPQVPAHAGIRPGLRIPTWPGRDLVALLRAARRDDGGLCAVDVPVALGRTDAEAMARAASDPVFAEVGDPRQTGLYGRLEDVQAQVAVLAAAGAGELCCILPAEDLLDHLAQLATVAVGRLDTHGPGLERSPDPSPPVGWGAPSGP